MESRILFHGEQVRVYHEFNREMQHQNPVGRVRYTMNQNLLTACPKVLQEVKPLLKKRKVEE